MISLAICDDDNAVVSQIEQYVGDVSASMLDGVGVAVFLSGADLCGELDKGTYFDLIFMDIEMDNIDGITTGQLLRGKYGHDSTLLIYVSSHTKYHGRLFDVQPFQFIQKPIDRDDFCSKLKLALKKIESGNEIYRYKKGRDYFQVKKKDIISVESKKHNILLSLSDETPIQFRGVFKDELKQLTNIFFIQPHVAYVVNINHVKSFHGTHLIMDNGSLVPISEHRAKDVKYAFLHFEGN